MNEKEDSMRSVAENLADRVARPVVYRLPDMGVIESAPGGTSGIRALLRAMRNAPC
jgi:hypothetical protein